MKIIRKIDKIPKEHAYPVKFGAIEESLHLIEASNISHVSFYMTKIDNWTPLLRLHRWGGNRSENAGKIVITVYSVESSKRQQMREIIMDKIVPKIKDWVCLVDKEQNLVDVGVLFGVDDGEMRTSYYGGDNV